MRRPRFIVLVLGACLAGPVLGADPSAIDQAIANGDYALASTLLDAEIASTPADPAPRFQKAQVLRYDGSFDEALRLLDALRTEFPDNVDYAFERALCHAAAGRNEDALVDVEDAIRLSPDYEDLWTLRFRLLSRDASLADDDTLAAWLGEAEKRFPGSVWNLPPEPAPPDWTLTVGGSYDRLDRGFDDWNRQFVGLAREVSGSYRHAVELSRNARSSFTDYALGATADYQLPRDWITGAYVGLAAGAEFMPEYDLSVHGGRVLADGWIVDLGVRYRDFPTTEVLSANVTVEKYIAAFRAAYRFSVSSLPDAPSFNGHGLTINWFYSDVANVGVSLGTGREIESLGGGRLLETDVTSLSVTGRHGITDRISIDWWLGMHDQGDLYRRRFVGLAVSLKL